MSMLLKFVTFRVIEKKGLNNFYGLKRCQILLKTLLMLDFPTSHTLLESIDGLLESTGV